MATSHEKHSIACPYCGGTGEWDEGPMNMGSWDLEPEYRQVKCKDCDGTGKVAVEACPFCGSPDVFVERDDTASAYVFCNDCSARGPVGSLSDDFEETPGGIEAVEGWNKRPSPLAHCRRNERMETHYEISVWDIVEGDIVKKLWDASEDELDELREQYEDEPMYEVVIDREWEEPADEAGES